MIVYFENERGEQFKVETENAIDEILDQLNIFHPKYITDADFKVTEPMVIPIMDGTNTTQLAELTMQKFDI